MPWQQGVFIVFPQNGLPCVPAYGAQPGPFFEQQGYEHGPVHPAPGGVQETVQAVAEDFADGPGVGREHNAPAAHGLQEFGGQHKGNVFTEMQRRDAQQVAVGVLGEEVQQVDPPPHAGGKRRHALPEAVEADFPARADKGHMAVRARREQGRQPAPEAALPQPGGIPHGKGHDLLPFLFHNSTKKERIMFQPCTGTGTVFFLHKKFTHGLWILLNSIFQKGTRFLHQCRVPFL